MQLNMQANYKQQAPAVQEEMPHELSNSFKFDEGKLRYDLLPTDVVRQIVEILSYGAAKYEDRNWEKGMRWGRVYAAAQRHQSAFWEGQNNDEESAYSHIAHAIANLMFLLEYVRTHPELDDRP